MKKVVHLIPYDGIGGVEAAAQTMPDGQVDGETFFTKLYLTDDPTCKLNLPATYLRVLRKLLQEKPDILIASLWRCYLVLIIYKLLRPRAQVVTFLHAATNAHLPDRILAWFAMCVSKAIWADSQQTIEGRVPQRWRRRAQVISFLLDRLEPHNLRRCKPNFIFLGRLTRQKGLGRALDLFGIIHRAMPDARFHIIGPDRGELAVLQQQVAAAELSGAVQFYGGLSRNEIFDLSRQSTFYLQTSLWEGMAISVVEAMQLGLVPVVTPVGEIACYCRDGVNSILVHDLNETANRVLSILQNAEKYELLSTGAAASWIGKDTYFDSVTAEIMRLV